MSDVSDLEDELVKANEISNAQAESMAKMATGSAALAKTQTEIRKDVLDLVKIIEQGGTSTQLKGLVTKFKAHGVTLKTNADALAAQADALEVLKTEAESIAAEHVREDEGGEEEPPTESARNKS